MIFLRPEQGICHQEIPHLRTFKIEHRCIRKGASVLIERRTVKVRRTEGILREARAGPFHDNADPLPVQCVHHGPELVRSTVPGGGRIETGALVSQRLVQRMLHQRQQLDMGIVHFCRVIRKLLPELRIRHSAVPSAGISLESRERHLFRRVLLPRLHPGFIGPAESVRCRYHGSGARSQFGFPGVGICLQADLPVRPLDLILVEFPGLHAGKKDLEHAAFIKLPHLMTSSVPSVEGPDYRDPHGAGCPDSKTDSGNPPELHRPGSHPPAYIRRIACGEFLQTRLLHCRRKSVGILQQFFSSVFPLHTDLIRYDTALRKQTCEKALFILQVHFHGGPGLCTDCFRLHCSGEKCLDQEAFLPEVRAQDRMGIRRFRIYDLLHFCPVHQIV